MINSNLKLIVDIRNQNLLVREGDTDRNAYVISSAKAGVGEQKNSYQTPRGLHVIRACIGEGAPLNSVFVGRRATGEIYSPELGAREPDRDWILTRILWLSGKTPGFNRLGEVDSMQRYIYIHGSPDEGPFGMPASCGCIRMRNQDIIELYEQVGAGTEVWIE